MMILNDFKYALRLLLKRPSFTILTVLVMATGIGLSAYMLSYLHTQMFKHLPFEDGETLVQFYTARDGVRQAEPLNLHDYAEVKSSVKGVGEFGAYKDVNLNVAGRDGARRYSGVAVSANMFGITRTKPAMGREFTEAETQMGAEKVAVIGYDVWKNQFGGDQKIIDKTLIINSESHRIIGVMPQGYFFPSIAEVWIPLRENASQLNRGEGEPVFGLGHLKPGVTMEQVNTSLQLVMNRLEQRYPKTNHGVGAYVEFIPRAVIGDAIAVIYSMQIIAILILVLASVNVGNLLLSRAIERSKETAIRVALGAPRSRLISQMLWESIIICVLGGVIGMIILSWGLQITQTVTATFSVDRPPFWWNFGIDDYTLSVTLSFIVGTILVTGLLPAWKNSGGDFNSVLRDGTRGAISKKTGRLNRMLVIGEIFVSLTVLIAAGVMTIVNYNAVDADYGSKTDSTLTADVFMTELKYDTPQKQALFIQALESRLENDATIGDVMISSALPGVYGAQPSMAMEGKEYNEDKGYPTANYIVVSPGSLGKLGVELKEGRYFNKGDNGLEKSTVIVTESFAAAHFPDGSPIGKQLRVVEGDSDELNWLTIVGVVETTIQGAPFDQTNLKPSVFRPFAQSPQAQVTVAMQMKAGQNEVTSALRKTLASIDAELPAFAIETYRDKIARHTDPLKFVTTIFLMMGIAAAVLASSGIYGVIANTINQRTQEIGVKQALGAEQKRITREYIMIGFKQLLWGGIPGILLGCLMGLGMTSVFPVTTTHLMMVATLMVSLIGGVVMLATYLPTKRALEMEPSEALRYE